MTAFRLATSSPMVAPAKQCRAENNRASMWMTRLKANRVKGKERGMKTVVRATTISKEPTGSKAKVLERTVEFQE